MGEENFHERGAGSSSILKKTKKKISMKSFFQLDVRSSIKT